MAQTLFNPNQILGGGAGGSINYISNSNAEVDTAGWTTYADAAQTDPVDGSGGSPALTWTRSVSSPLRGVANFQWDKDAANRQGNGVSYTFTTDSADKARMLYVSFDYEGSTYFADDDLGVWLYDVTNGVLIQPAPYLVKKASFGQPASFSAAFQTAINSTSYRLIIHQRTTNANAVTIRFDNFRVGPNYEVMGSPVTDWKAFTPSWTNFSTSSNTGYWRRVGDSMQLFISATSSGAATGAIGVSLPSGYSIDSSKIAPSNDYKENFGGANAINASSFQIGYAYYAGTALLNFSSHAGASRWGVTVPFTWVSGDAICANFTVPITGWSSSVVMSSDSDTRVCAARATAAGQSISGTTLINYSTVSHDTHGAFTTGASSKFTAPVAGYYRVSASLCYYGSWTANYNAYVYLYKNGSQYSFTGLGTASAGLAYLTPTLVDTVYLNTGDYIDIRGANDANFSLVNNVSTDAFKIERVSGPSQIAATETVTARYTTATNAAVGTSDTLIDFDTKQYDSHGAVTTGASWKFTAPIPGIYRVTVGMVLAAARQALYIGLYKNGVVNQYVGTLISNDAASQQATHGSGSIRLLAGDYIDIRESVSVSSTTLTSNANLNWVTIERVGNYV
jgi:hypothetical protein